MTQQVVAEIVGVDARRDCRRSTWLDLARAKQFAKTLLDVVRFFSAPRRALHAFGMDGAEEQTQHAFGVDDTLRVAAPHLVFSVWVILNEHKWVTFP
jgi:hypothetical protein